MQTVVIPDIHEDWQTAEKIITKYADKPLIFLGDWFDSFTHSERSASCTLDLLKDVARDPNATLLWGNHDIHYAWSNVPGIHCSGFNEWTNRHLKDQIPIDRFGLSVMAEGFVLSHAGWADLPQLHTQAFLNVIWQDALDLLDARTLPPIFYAGWRRGGRRDALGGPVWLDWRDFKPLDGIRQIVGHTPDTRVRWKEGNLCLDTGLKHVALIENGQVEIVPV